MLDKERYKIVNGDSLQVLDTFEPNSIDAIITDPPYELGFMGKSWDKSGIAYNVELWKKALRVLKAGGFLLAFGGSRTYHRIACAIEDAGFEIRDTIMWLYGSGFPKSMNIGLAIDKKNGVESIDTGITSPNARPNSDKSNTLYESGTVGKEFTIKKATNEWGGWGTALKPAFEPIIVARKPVENSVVENVTKYGVGGINIDECRVKADDEIKLTIRNTASSSDGWVRPWMADKEKDANRQMAAIEKANEMGRFPANVILTYDETDFDEVCGNMPETSSQITPNDNRKNEGKSMFIDGMHNANNSYDDSGNACRYFYCAKASKKDRDSGLIEFETKTKVFNGQSDKSSKNIKDVEERFTTEGKNIHPTVKPVELMQYLVRLVSPKGATVLDIFNGSGSTGKAVAFENRERDADYKYIGIELDADYCRISESRIDYAINQYKYDIAEEIKENEKKGQLSLFDDYGI